MVLRDGMEYKEKAFLCKHIVQNIAGEVGGERERKAPSTYENNILITDDITIAMLSLATWSRWAS